MVGRMSKQVIETSEAPRSPLFSQRVRVGPIIYVSGMTGMDPATKQLAGSTIGEQTRQALDNCVAVVRAGGGSVDDVVQVTVLLADPGDFAGMNDAFRRCSWGFRRRGQSRSSGSSLGAL